jgi:hypothetical protein
MQYRIQPFARTKVNIACMNRLGIHSDDPVTDSRRYRIEFSPGEVQVIMGLSSQPHKVRMSKTAKKNKQANNDMHAS